MYFRIGSGKNKVLKDVLELLRCARVFSFFQFEFRSVLRAQIRKDAKLTYNRIEASDTIFVFETRLPQVVDFSVFLGDLENGKSQRNERNYK